MYILCIKLLKYILCIELNFLKLNIICIYTINYYFLFINIYLYVYNKSSFNTI